MGILYLIFGFVLGFAAYYMLNIRKSFGTLEIDMTNKEEPYYRLMMSNEDFQEIPKHSTVIFRVNSKAKFTQDKQGL